MRALTNEIGFLTNMQNYQGMAQPVTRVLGWGPTWGQITLQLKVYGSNPTTRWGSTHAGYASNYVLEGKGLYRDSRGLEYQIRPGSLYQRRPEVEASFEITSDTFTEFFVLADESTMQGLSLLHLLDAASVLEVPVEVALPAFERLREACILPFREISRRRLILELCQFYTTIFEQAVSQPSAGYWSGIVHKGALLLGRNLDQKRSPESVAHELNVSYTAFRRAFRRIMQCSPTEYRIRRRLNRACDLLTHNQVQEVSEALGYCDPYTFSAQFKKYLGHSPAQFQKRLGHVPQTLLET